MLISVVIPCYNHAHFLPEAVESALAQTYPHVEVIVVDDGSTDDTRAVAAAYGERIRYVHQTNAGLSAARNAGIRAARGELIGVLDADDRWLPRKLEAQAPAFADPAVGLSHTAYRRFSSAGIVDTMPAPDGPSFGFEEFLLQNRIGVLTAVFRRSVALEVGGYDETLRSCEDWDMWIRIAAKHRVVGCAEVLAEYRLSDNSMSTNYLRMYRSRLRVLEKNRLLEGDTPRIRQLVGEAKRLARRQYFADLTQLARRQAEAGQTAAARRTRLRALAHHPRLYNGVRGLFALPNRLTAPREAV